MKFIILVLFNIVQFQMFHMLLGIKVDQNRSFNDLLQCRICMDLYTYDYNYEEYIKSDKTLANLQIFMSENYNQSKLDFIDKSKLELFSRETSMKYFFNSGEENLELKKANCKGKEINNVILRKESLGLFEDCEIKLSNNCEKILSKQKDFCYVNSLYSISDSNKVNVQIKLENKNEIVNKNKNEELVLSTKKEVNQKHENENEHKSKVDEKSNLDLIKKLISENKLLREVNLEKNKKSNIINEKMEPYSINNKDLSLKYFDKDENINKNEVQKDVSVIDENPINKLENLSKLLNLETQKLLLKNENKSSDSLNKNFKNKQRIISNINKNVNIHNKSKNSNILNSSMLELEIAPEIVEKNYVPFSEKDALVLKKHSELNNLRSNLFNNSNQTNNNIPNEAKSWSAPKPVIFDNFQDSLANQLKDISYLSR